MAYFHAFNSIRLWECIKPILVESLRRLSPSHLICSDIGRSIFGSILFAIERCFILPETLVFSTAAERIAISHWVHLVFTESRICGLGFSQQGWTLVSIRNRVLHYTGPERRPSVLRGRHTPVSRRAVGQARGGLGIVGTQGGVVVAEVVVGPP